MLRLTTFGGVALTRDGSPVVGAASAQRRLALVVLLAGSGSRGLVRETLAALMWPDSEDAKHSLDQALYMTRQAVGFDDLFVGTSTIHLNPTHIECDVWEFESARRSRNLELAASLYHGPFADGFRVRGAPDVDRRIEILRTNLARDWAAVVETLARSAADRRDHIASARWWLRLVEEDRLSARAAKEYIAALVAGGEPAQALQFALAYQKLVREETGREADPEILRWIEQIRGAKPHTPPPPIHDVVVPNDDDAIRKRRVARVSSALGRRYRIEQLREAGAMLETYTAVALTALGPEVEVHVVRPTAAATSDTSRFVASLKRASLLAHPKVLAIFDVELSNDLLYFVSARRGGRSLRERLRHERALPMRDALRIGRDIVAALAHAHERGVHHGDLRPKHVSLVGESAVVGGFGVLEGLSPDIDTSGRTTIAAWGSPTYLSPEQLSGDVHVDARSDVYSAGCILYEMLAGEPPFGRQRSAGVAAKKLTESPARLRTLRESVPEGIEDIVHHCLMRVPADRFASGSEVAQALAELEAPI